MVDVAVHLNNRSGAAWPHYTRGARRNSAWCLLYRGIECRTLAKQGFSAAMEDRGPGRKENFRSWLAEASLLIEDNEVAHSQSLQYI